MNRIFFLIFFIVLTSCNLFNKVENQPSNNNISDLKIRENINDAENSYVQIQTYDGKYSIEKNFFSKEKIEKICKELEILLAEKIGLEETAISIHIKYVDWESRYGNEKYFITPVTEFSKRKWEIVYIAEYLQNKNISPSIIYKTSLAEALIRNISESGYSKLPKNIWQSAVYYGCGLEEFLEKTVALKILNEPNISLENAAIGLDAPIVSEIDSLLLLTYLENKYSDNDKRTTKLFLYKILFEQVEWQQQLLRITGQDFGDFVLNHSTFCKNYLFSKYRFTFSKYNDIVKNYLNKEYGSAIAKSQTFLLNYPESFLISDTYFWMALSYYHLKNYNFCIQQLDTMFSEHSDYSYHFTKAKYRYAISLYRLEKLSYAVEAFSNFQSDFPWEINFVGSALFFQAQSLLANNQNERAIYFFENFIQKFPDHKRFPEAAEKIAYIYLQRERYRRAYELFTLLLKSNANTSMKTAAKKSIDTIAQLEQRPSDTLQQELNKILEDYPTYTTRQKRETLNEISLIGKVAFPWLRKMKSEDVFPEFIDCVAKMQTPVAISLLFDVARESDQFDDKILISVIEMGIPPIEMQSILDSEFSSLPQKRRDKLQQNFQNIFWNAPISVLQKIPEFISLVNGTAEDQLKVMEKMELALGEEQTPVLRALILKGKSEQVKIRALKDLFLWQKPNTYSFVEGILPQISSDMRLAILENFVKIKYYDVKNLQQMFQDKNAKVRYEALKILPFSTNYDKIEILVNTLNDADYSIRNRTRELLLQSKNPNTNLVLAQGLAKETENIQYYTYVIGILRTRTKLELLDSYNPKMDSQTRIKLMEQLITKLR